MYSGTIYLNNVPIAVADAVAQGLITQDADGNIWLAADTNQLVVITGDLYLTS